MNDSLVADDTSCSYDIELLGRARLFMSNKHYQEALERSAAVLSCKDGLEPRTLVDIYRMRADAYGSLYSDPPVAEDVSVKALEPLISSLSEYVLLDGLIHEYDLDIGVYSAKSVRNEISLLIVGLFDNAMFIRARDGVEPSLVIFEKISEALDLLHFDSKSFAAMGAVSSELSGRFYLGRRDIEKAKRYFNNASKQLLRSAPGVDFGAELENKRVSQLFYNLGGIYYSELLELRRQIRSSGGVATVVSRKQEQSLSSLADEYFRLSYQYDPNNVSAIRASKSLNKQ